MHGFLWWDPTDYIIGLQNWDRILNSESDITTVIKRKVFASVGSSRSTLVESSCMENVTFSVSCSYVGCKYWCSQYTFFFERNITFSWFTQLLFSRPKYNAPTVNDLLFILFVTVFIFLHFSLNNQERKEKLDYSSHLNICPF